MYSLKELRRCDPQEIVKLHINGFRLVVRDQAGEMIYQETEKNNLQRKIVHKAHQYTRNLFLYLEMYSEFLNSHLNDNRVHLVPDQISNADLGFSTDQAAVYINKLHHIISKLNNNNEISIFILVHEMIHAFTSNYMEMRNNSLRDCISGFSSMQQHVKLNEAITNKSVSDIVCIALLNFFEIDTNHCSHLPYEQQLVKVNSQEESNEKLKDYPLYQRLLTYKGTYGPTMIEHEKMLNEIIDQIRNQDIIGDTQKSVWENIQRACFRNDFDFLQNIIIKTAKKWPDTTGKEKMLDFVHT